LNDPEWADWSESILENYSQKGSLYINPIIYSEVSIGFERIEDLEKVLNGCGFQMMSLPKEALFLAGKVFLKYKKRKGTKVSTLPDFFIGAHAAIYNMELITRDVARYHAYFPTVKLIHPG
jgi:predicted nucleic acid-binding protein